MSFETGWLSGLPEHAFTGFLSTYSSKVPALVATLKDRELFARKAAAEALGNIGIAAKEAVPALIAVLSDSYGNVRKAAAEALGNIGIAAKEAVPALIVALKDSESDVRRAAKNALEAIQK